jgi:hypothetical protein
MRMRTWLPPRFGLLIVGVSILLGSSSSAVSSHQNTANQPMGTDEIVVRTAYAKLSYADEIRILKTMLQPATQTDVWKADRLAADQALKERLSFQLSNFKSGNVADIALQKLSDLVTTWDLGSDTLQANAGMWNYSYAEGGNSVTASVPYGTFFWEKSAYPKTEVADWPLSDVLAKGPEFQGPYTRYVTYTVKVTFQRHALTYKAMTLFRDDSEVYFIDNVTSASMLALLAKTPIYPEPLAETHLRNVPFVRKWLFDHKQACSAGHVAKGDACCDLPTGVCGIGEQDLQSPGLTVPKEGKQWPISRRRKTTEPLLVEASFHPHQPAMLLPVAATADCSASSQTTIFPHVLTNGKDHLTGNHNFTANIPAKCTYSNGPVGQANCNTQCTSGTAGVPGESGITIVWPFHPKTTSDFTGQAFSVSGSAQCQGTSATAVMGCILPGCAVGLSITASQNGVGATINFPPGSLWNDQNTGLITCNAIPQPTPTPTPPPPPPPIGPPPDPCLNSVTVAGPGGTFNAPDCSPIIIDPRGEGFHLTSAGNGVTFDMTGTGNPVPIGWTDGHFQNAFLTLPGPDGLVHNGKELFGNFTPQPPSPNPNGYLALAVYDQPEKGGNGDGMIDARDAIFSSLRLWIDKNHDGVCQPEELFTLPELGVFSLSLDFSLSRRQDEYGNVFRYRSKVNPLYHGDKSQAGSWAYDVFLTGH